MVVAVVGLAVYLLLPRTKSSGDGVADGGSGASQTPTTSSAFAAPIDPPPCRTSLTVTDAPEDSEILMRVGQSPADIDRMPVGVRLELVATAEGYDSSRAVVPAGAAWSKGANGRPRFELPIELERTKAKPGHETPWPAGEPGSEIGGRGTGAPGVLHVTTSPRGAELWLLAGLGPSATVDDLAACDSDVDILVAGPRALRKRIHLPAAAFVADATKGTNVRSARVSVGARGDDKK